MTLNELREFIQLFLVERDALASRATTRASKSESSGPVSEILLRNLPRGWEVVKSAPSGSNSTDVVLSDDAGQEVHVEVKDYNDDAVFKVEILSDSELSKLFGVSKGSFAAKKSDISRRIVGSNKEKILKDATKALKTKKRLYVGLTKVDTQGVVEPRHIVVVKGDEGDWTRVRHSAAPNSSARMLYTVSTEEIANLASQAGSIPVDKVADAIRIDFSSKGDQYLFLYDGSSKIRGFSLRDDSDPLGLNLPVFDGSKIFTYRFATHGGGIRPSIKIVVRRESGEILK